MPYGRLRTEDPEAIRKRAHELFAAGLTNAQIAERLNRSMDRIAELKREWKKLTGRKAELA
jgi:IS30 family transposase